MARLHHFLRHGSIGIALLGLASIAATLIPQRLAYPSAHKGDVVDDYHGVKVADPYRWMEDVDSPETHAWIEAENKLTFAYLDAIPGREAIRKRLTELWDYERYGVPTVYGKRIFFSRNSGLQPQSVLYVLDSAGAQPRALLDPNMLSADGTVAISQEQPSNDGRWLAYGTSAAGSDWQEWRVRDVGTAKDTTDLLKWVKFTNVAWTNDGKGFYYSRFDEPPAGTELKMANYFEKLCYHTLGTAQSADPIVYRRDDHKDWEFSPHVTDDGRYLIITVHVGSDRRNMVFYRDLQATGGPVVELLKDFDASYALVGNDGPVFYFRTDQGAPRCRLVAIDTSNPVGRAWREVIPEQAQALMHASLMHGTFVASYLKDATSAIRLYSKDGKAAGEVALPGLGSVMGFTGRQLDTETFYAFSGFAAPTTIFRYDLTTGKSELFRQPHFAADLAGYETRQIFYTSKDGTKVPMFLVYRKGLKLDGTNPTLLYGYGGFDISMTPWFSVPNLVWMEMGGIYAQANLRGGGEYGEAWHQAGMLKNKQNVFDDFIAAAEWLITNRYTSKERLAIFGGSNGGLLVGAVLNQRPDLFGAACPAVGVMDMLRFQRFTVGWGWVSDYGSADDPEMFPVLLKYSPLHNIKPGTPYPPTLITTADHDDRVVPSHSFKYAAALQAAQGGDAPILIRIETRAGHGGGRPTAKLINDATDRLAFLVKALGTAVPPSWGPTTVK
ncbi:MAG: prolyl oligopeptidase family protein [Thermoanaerobaculales bacterium]